LFAASEYKIEHPPKLVRATAGPPSLKLRRTLDFVTSLSSDEIGGGKSEHPPILQQRYASAKLATEAVGNTHRPDGNVGIGKPGQFSPGPDLKRASGVPQRLY